MAKGGAREGSGRKGFEDRRTLYASVDGRHTRLLDEYVVRHKLASRSAAIRRIIERATRSFKKVGNALNGIVKEASKKK